MQRGFKDPVGSIFLNKDDVWKYGQTRNGPARYSGAFLDNTGAGLKFKSEFKTRSEQIVLQVEKRKIVQHEAGVFGMLPAGNKIRR